MKKELLEQPTSDVSVMMQYFEKEKPGKINKKTGKEVTVLNAIQRKHNLSFIVNFISDLLPGIIHHRNHLRHYRFCMPEILSLYENCITLDANFAENLKVPVKYESQTMHWCHQQITIHSGITKSNGEKTYHAYFSDDTTHDQVFVDTAMKEMLKEEDI